MTVSWLMTVGYSQTKRERILFLNVPATTAWELAHCPAASAIVTWYMIHHPTDRIAFVSDTFDDWPFKDGERSELRSYTEVTDQVVAQLIEQGILVDHGPARYFSGGEEETYDRDLRIAP